MKVLLGSGFCALLALATAATCAVACADSPPGSVSVDATETGDDGEAGAPADTATPKTGTDHATDASAPADPTPTDPPPPETPATQNGECNVTSGDSTSVTKISWEEKDGAVTLTKMTVLVKNASNRDQNDVDVYVTLPGSSEKKAFNSGDVLKSGKEVTLQWPTSANLEKGAKIKISTNFDMSGSDPSKACTITL